MAALYEGAGDGGAEAGGRASDEYDHERIPVLGEGKNAGPARGRAGQRRTAYFQWCGAASRGNGGGLGPIVHERSISGGYGGRSGAAGGRARRRRAGRRRAIACIAYSDGRH
jgi:hypothetical protein